MNVAIVGSSGYIAEYLNRRFEQEDRVEKVLKIGHTGDVLLELQEPEKFDYDLLSDIDFIAFTAGISEPDKCALDFEYCWSVNVTGTVFFITEAIKKGCRVLFLSSDAVFGDRPGEIYTEKSEMEPVTPYGQMKKKVEEQFCGEAYFKAVRLPYVVSMKDRFVSYCLECIKKGKTADVFHPFYRSCITVSDVTEVVLWLAEHWEAYLNPVLNVAGKELVSRVRIADELNRNLGNKLRYNISTPGEAFYRNRPKITQMKSLYMQEYHILVDNSFTEKLKREFEDIEKK